MDDVDNTVIANIPCNAGSNKIIANKIKPMIKAPMLAILENNPICFKEY